MSENTNKLTPKDFKVDMMAKWCVPDVVTILYFILFKKL